MDNHLRYFLCTCGDLQFSVHHPTVFSYSQNWHDLAQVNGSQYAKLPIQNILNYTRYVPKHLKFPNFF